MKRNGHERARIVAERVADRIREVSPEGLGHWKLAFEIVATASDTFMDALAEWEAEDSTVTRSHLEVAGADLIGVWAEAACQWKEAGCPTLDKTNVKTVEVDVEKLAEYASEAPR